MPQPSEMPQRVVYTGPPGSGKTRRLLTLFHHARREGREDRALLIVPDAGAREHMRDMLARHAPKDVPSAFSGKGLQSLASLVRFLGGTPSAGPLHCRALVDKWVDPEEGKLDYNNPPVLATSGGHAALAAAIMTLRRHGHDARSLGSVISKDSSLLKAMRLWEEWLEKSGENDERDCLKAAVGSTREKEWDLVLIDGFTEIPPLQWDVIGALIDRAERSYAAVDPWQAPSERLLQQFKSIGFAEEPCEAGGRWEKACALEWLAEVKSWTVDARRPDILCPEPRADELVFLEAGNPCVEAAAVTRQVARCVKDGYAYSDIAIIAPHLGGFRPHLESEFRRAGIPLRFFIDRPLSSTAPGALLKAILNVAAGEWSDESVCALLSHPGSGVDPFEAREAAKLTGTERRLDTRNKWLEWLGEQDNWKSSGLLSRLSHLAGRSTIDPSTLADDLLDLAGEPLRAGWRNLPDEVLAEEGWAWERAAETIRSAAHALSNVNGAQSPTVIATFLRSELESAKAKPLDRRRDCVNALPLLGARTWSVPVAIVCGLSRENFPRRRTPDAFLPDRLLERLEPPLPTTREMLKRERALFRVAVSRAHERLVLSRPIADEAGSPLPISAPLGKLREWLAEETAERFTRRVARVPPSKVEHAVFPTDIAALALNAGIHQGEFIELLSKRCDRALAGPVTGESYKRATAPDTEELVKAACGSRENPITPTRLNDLAQCPYRFFASRLLGLREPERDRLRTGLDPLQWGLIAHDALAAWHNGGRADDFDTLVSASADKRLKGIPPSSEIDGRLRQIVSALERFRKFEEEFILPLRFEQKHAELSFDAQRREGERDPIEIVIGKSRTLILGGRIDRVDIGEDDSCSVIDYKRSVHSAKADLKRLTEGRNFQLACYIALAKEGLGLDVALAFFMPLNRGEGEVVKVIAGPDWSERLDDRAFKRTDKVRDPDEHLREAKEEIARLIDMRSSGDITPLPQEMDLCGEKCPYRDLCRYRFTGDEGDETGGGE